jgi:hypothetical protein
LARSVFSRDGGSTFSSLPRVEDGLRIRTGRRRRGIPFPSGEYHVFFPQTIFAECGRKNMVSHQNLVSGHILSKSVGKLA